MLDMATIRTAEDLKIVINKVGKCTQELNQKNGKTTRLSIPRITILRETMFK
jgi:NAD(P)H-flavin reductase